jgi:membrane protein implicated in regulation of membrane protease activity
MIELIIVGFVLLLFGIAALFVPSLSKIINIPLPVSDKVKALILIIISLILIAYGYFA